MRHSNLEGKTAPEKLPKLNQASLIRLLKLGKTHKKSLIVSALLMLVSTGVSLCLPILARDAIDGLQTRGISALDEAAKIAAGLLLIQGVVTYFNYYLIARTGNLIVMETRLNLFQALQRLTVSFFDRNRSGDLTSTLSNDVSLLQTSLTDDLVKFGGNILQLVGGVVLALVIDWRLTVFVVGLMAIMLVYFVVFGVRLRNLSRKSLDQLSLAMGGMTEALANIRLVKAFAREAYEDKRASVGLRKVFDLNMKAVLSEGLMNSIASAGSALMLTGIVWFGGRAVFEHQLSAGNLLAFLIVIAIISSPMGSLASLYTRLQRATGASDRIFKLLDEEPDPTDPERPIPFPETQGMVAFKDVGFSYRPDIPILKGLSLNLNPGKLTAIVGKSGAGKTTLSSLLYRFYEIQSGSIEIDGVSINQIKTKDLRENIGLVPQDTVLFSDTIFENILYGNLGASESEVIDAAKGANLWEFIESLPEGLLTLVGERGVTLSGGQRQRVAIARVILKNPRILVLDEATSALDTISEALVKDALDRLMKGRTTMVIAHRLSTIQSADQIAVLDDGVIQEVGRHEELLRMSGRYAELYHSLEIEEFMDSSEGLEIEGAVHA